MSSDALILTLNSSLALAHLVTTGMGPVYDGIGHLLLTPEDGWVDDERARAVIGGKRLADEGISDFQIREATKVPIGCPQLGHTVVLA